MVIANWLKSKSLEQWNVPHEAFYTILKNSQCIFPVKDFDETIFGLHVASLRVDDMLATEVFGSKFLPLISSEDDFKWKLIRFAHEDITANLTGNRSVHHLQKVTKSRLVTGAIGCMWRKNFKDVEQYIFGCGVCLKFKKYRYTPVMQKSLTKGLVTGTLFSHISVDPLGTIKANFGGSSFSKLIHPLIIVDINLGAVEMELMLNNKTKNVFLALMRLQDRYHTKITQIFSDKGSNLLATNLGSECKYYAKKLKDLWEVKNNIPQAQHRNYAERYVQMLKKLMKQGIYGEPGSHATVIDFEILQVTVTSACRMINCLPYLDPKNTTLITPGDFLNPGTVGEPEVQNLPKGNLDHLVKMRIKVKQRFDKMIMIRNSMLALEYEKYLKQKLHMGRNRRSLALTIGDVVMIPGTDKSQGGEMGVCVQIDGGTAEVRLRHKTVKVATAILAPVVALDPDKTDMAEKQENPAKTHFVSIEADNTQGLVDNIQEIQTKLKEQFGERLGKPYKKESLHITLCVLGIEEDEEANLKKKVELGWDKFRSGLYSTGGFLLTFGGLGFFEDTNSIYIKVDIGKELLGDLRSCMDEELKGMVSDQRFTSHMTIFRNSMMTNEELIPIINSMSGKNAGMMICNSIALRAMKQHAVKSPNPRELLLLTLEMADE